MNRGLTIIGVGALAVATALGLGCDRGRGWLAHVPEPVTSAVTSTVAVATADPAPRALDWRRDASLANVDARVTEWMAHTPQVGNNVACAMTCHTAMPAALAHGALALDSPALVALRSAIVERVASVDDWAKATPFYGAKGTSKARESLATEAVLDAVSLAAIDRTRGATSDETRRALDQMWAMQRPDGGFDWLDFRLEPFEAGESAVGAALAARAVALVGGAQSDADTPRIARLRGYLSASLRDPATILFDKALMLWGAGGVASSLDEVFPLYTEIARKQAEDGAWSWAALGVIGKRGRVEEGDALPTAIAVLGLCGATEPSAVEARRRGVGWLVAAQSADGAFLSRSPNRDRPFSHLVMSDAATGFAAVALTECAR